MEAQQQKQYGEGFRQGVTKLLDEVGKLGVLSQKAQEKVTLNAAKICLAEAVAEQKAAEIADRAKHEWDKQRPELEASFTRLAKASQAAMATLEQRIAVELPAFLEQLGAKPAAQTVREFFKKRESAAEPAAQPTAEQKPADGKTPTVPASETKH